MSRRTCWGLGVLGLALSTSAVATVVVAQSLEEMAAAAPVIVVGKVGQVQSRWDEARARIYTYAEIASGEHLKGEAPKTFLVRQPGGEVGPIGQQVSGAAQFEAGEDVALFLEKAPDEAGVFIVYAMAAGKVLFETSRVGEVRAVRHLEGLAFYELSATAKPRLRQSGPDDLGTPAQFLSRVRAAVARTSGSRP